MNFVEFLRSPFLQNTSLDTSLHIFFLFILFLQSFSSLFFISLIWVWKLITAWKVSRYGVFSGPYFTVFGLNTERYCMSIFVLCMSMYKKCSFFWKFGVVYFLETTVMRLALQNPWWTQTFLQYLSSIYKHF